MEFWIFMLIMELIIPFTMILMGKHFIQKPPKEINAIFGYRTSMSMKNKNTWNFAHNYCGKLWIRIGIALLPVTVIPMLFVIKRSYNIIGTIGIILSLIQILALIFPIVPTEKALRKQFDEYGNKRM